MRTSTVVAALLIIMLGLPSPSTARSESRVDVAPAGTLDVLMNGLEVSGPIPLFDYTSTSSAVV